VGGGSGRHRGPLSGGGAGAGVPEDMRTTIFEPFRQGSETVLHSPGVGVGLSLVARFAQLHEGKAWVEEREGGGASFRVFLPHFVVGDALAAIASGGASGQDGSANTRS